MSAQLFYVADDFVLAIAHFARDQLVM